jgi:hypothetical protein
MQPSCPDLDLLVRPSDKAKILQMENSKFIETEKGDKGDGQSQQHALYLL